MKPKCHEVHNSALELLRIVDKFCVSENIIYTISSDTLINYAHLPFSKSTPIIYISLMYENFCKLEEYLKTFCENNKGYSIHNFSNTEQFNTLDMWFVKHSKVNVSESFYYGTRMVITPLFYAGNSYKEWLKTYKRYRDRIATLNLSALLPKKPLISRIKQLPKRLITMHYRPQRGKYSIEDIKSDLIQIHKSKYILYPYIIKKFNSPNTILWPMGKKTSALTYDFWDDVKRIKICGTECYCVSDINKFLKCLPKCHIDKVLDMSKNQLILQGGEKLRRVQLIQIELLKEFDRICRKNDLRYNLGFGTLLGAVRHKGFIPWDDDIDVTMPLEDYIKLDDAIKNDLDNEKYYYRTPDTEENNHLIFKHLERKGTIYTKPGRDKLKQKIGVFIDIFPMYPAAPNFILDWFHAKVCRFWRTALWATVGAESERNKIKRLYYCGIAKFGNKRCYRNFVKAATFFNNKKGRLKFWIAMDRNPYNVALVNEENYNDIIELDFEGHKFFAPKNYAEVLNYSFGEDWRYYPNICARMPTHNAIIDIGNLYKF